MAQALEGQARRGVERQGGLEAQPDHGRREDHAEAILKLIAGLEDDDDVQNVFANFEVSDEILSKLTGG